MSAWTLVPCLKGLHGEFDLLAPQRDHASDGAIGDAAHAKTDSDHNPDEDTPGLRGRDADSVNEVHAIDVDDDLRKAGWSMTRAVGIIVTRHRAGLDDRLQYVIYNRIIYSRSWGWTARAYTGPSPHTEHAHFSARYTSAQEADVRPWGLRAADVPPTPAGKTTQKPGSRTLRLGMTGTDVAFLQRWVGVKPVSGRYTAATELAVRRYQKIRGITIDGVCGPITWRNILGKA